jgi:predicted RNA-binding Zn-ribbon protein involved in translation (DUF1610 family)
MLIVSAVHRFLVSMAENLDDLKFECPHCAQHLEAEPDLYGREKHCPNCGGAFIVPFPDVYVEGPPPGSTEAVHPPETEINESIAIKFLCPSCGRKLSAVASEIGRELPCPFEDCRTPIIVPRPEWKPVPSSIMRIGQDDPNNLVRKGESITHKHRFPEPPQI